MLSMLRRRLSAVPPAVIGVGLLLVSAADLTVLATDAPGGKAPVAASAPTASAIVDRPSPGVSATVPATAVPRPLGPARILFSIASSTAPSRPTVLTILPDGTQERRRPTALALPLEQVSTKNDLAVTASVMNQAGGYYTGCGIAGCTSGYRGSTEQGLVFRRLSTGRTRVVTHGGYDSAPSWSPDGSLVVYLSHRRDPQGFETDVIALLDSAGRDLGPLSEDTWTAPAWAPNGRAVATVRPRRIHNGYPIGEVAVLGLDGTVLRTVANGPFTELRWSPDGRTIVAVRPRIGAEGTDGAGLVSGTDLWLIDAIRGGARPLTTFAPVPRSNGNQAAFCGEFGGYTVGVSSPQWSPDSRQIAFLSSYRHAPEFGRQSDLLVVDVRTRRVRVVRQVPRLRCSRSTADRTYTNLAVHGWVR